MQENNIETGRLAAIAAALAVFFAVMSYLPPVVWQLISLALGCISLLSLAYHLATGMTLSDKDDLAGKLIFSMLVFAGVLAYATWETTITYVVIAVVVPLLFGISIAVRKAPGPVAAPAAVPAKKDEVPPAA